MAGFTIESVIEKETKKLLDKGITDKKLIVSAVKKVCPGAMNQNIHRMIRRFESQGHDAFKSEYLFVYETPSRKVYKELQATSDRDALTQVAEIVRDHGMVALYRRCDGLSVS